MGWVKSGCMFIWSSHPRTNALAAAGGEKWHDENVLTRRSTMYVCVCVCVWERERESFFFLFLSFPHKLLKLIVWLGNFLTICGGPRKKHIVAGNDRRKWLFILLFMLAWRLGVFS